RCDAQAPSLGPELLGRNERNASHRTRVRTDARLQSITPADRDSEVSDPWLPIFSYENIARIEVAVHHAGAVGGLYTASDPGNELRSVADTGHSPSKVQPPGTVP